MLHVDIGLTVGLLLNFQISVSQSLLVIDTRQVLTFQYESNVIFYFRLVESLLTMQWILLKNKSQPH